MTGVEIPTLETERLRLRAPRMVDLDAFAAFWTSERSRAIGGPKPASEAFASLCALAGQWALRGFGRFVVADRETDAALGWVGPHFPPEWPEPEIAWTVFAPAEGRGVAREAALAARRFAYRRLGWITAISAVELGNARSTRLAERLGCVREGAFCHPDGFDLAIWRHPGPEAEERPA